MKRLMMIYQRAVAGEDCGVEGGRDFFLKKVEILEDV